MLHILLGIVRDGPSHSLKSRTETDHLRIPRGIAIAPQSPVKNLFYIVQMP